MGIEDIRCLSAYAKAATQVDILSDEEEKEILRGLQRIRREHANGKFRTKPVDKDIHEANERRLGELVSAEVAVKLATGSSKNDQVATATRMWSLKTFKVLQKDLGLLLELGSEYGREYVDILMAGYNNMQPSQTIRFSHWLMSHMTALMRDADRLKDTMRRTNVCPFGATGNVFGMDRLMMCQELGFTGGLSTNSLDSVADRDFVVEFLMWASLTCTHLSQMAEDLIIYNMLQGVQLDDEYATASSLMPQQKTPDALELLRGKAGTMVGRSAGLMCCIKGLPRAYNRDLQEANIALFEAVDTVKDCLAIATGVISTMQLKPDNMINSLRPDMLAKDLADYLIRKGVPSNETQNIASAALRLAEELTINISSLTLEQLQHIDPRFEEDVMEIWDYELSVERHDAVGGTGRDSVLQQIDACVTFARALQHQS
jgi:argininosuccinate lyase